MMKQIVERIVMGQIYSNLEDPDVNEYSHITLFMLPAGWYHDGHNAS